MSIEGTANTEYASLSGKIRTFVVDKSLTVSGACADAKATGDKLDSLIDNAETSAEKVASDTTNKKLADFLDSTLTKSDKAAQAAVVGARLDKLEALHPIEKLADVTITEDTQNFYIELPKNLSNYTLLIFKAIEVYAPGAYNNGGLCCAVESLESTEALYSVCGYRHDGNHRDFTIIMPGLNSNGEVTLLKGNFDDYYDGRFSTGHASGADTRYLFIQSDSSEPITAGRFEVWGFAE